MTRFEKIFYSVGFLLLLILFLLTSTRLFSLQETRKVSTISIITGEKDDLYWRNIRKGMEKAAADSFIDLNFVTLYDNYDRTQQEEMIYREIENQVDAIILAPVKGLQIEKITEETATSIPIIIIGEVLSGHHVTSQIHLDGATMGTDVAEMISRDRFASEKVYLFDEQQTEQDQLFSVIIQNFEEIGKPYEVIKGGSEELFTFLNETSEMCSVFIANERTLVEAAKMNTNQSIALYGIGSSSNCISLLEAEAIQGIIAPDMYVMGFQAMKEAIKAIEKERNETDIIVNYQVISSNTIFDKENEEFLFPRN